MRILIENKLSLEAPTSLRREDFVRPPWIDWAIFGCESRGQNLGRLGSFESETAWTEEVAEALKWRSHSGVKMFVKQIPLNGRVSQEMNEWPEDLRVREYPEVARA